MHVFYSITVFLFDFFKLARAATGVVRKGSSAALAWPENRSLVFIPVARSLHLVSCFHVVLHAHRLEKFEAESGQLVGLDKGNNQV